MPRYYITPRFSLFTDRDMHGIVAEGKEVVCMLARPDLYAVLQKDNERKALEHFHRAVRIRYRFVGLPIVGTNQIVVPTCHEVAHAYAHAFGVEAEDGMCFRITGRGISPEFPLGAAFLHSWNIITVAPGLSVTLDVFPDVGVSMMPILQSRPHPMYIPSIEDRKLHERFREHFTSRKFATAVEILADEFRRLEPAHP